MRAKRTTKILPGEKLGKTIYNTDGTPLLVRGVTLSARRLMRLEEEGILLIYVDDELSEGIESSNPISDETLIKGSIEIAKVFESIKDQTRLSNGKDKDLTYVYESLHIETLSKLIDDVQGELMEHPDALYQIMNISSVDMYTYKHSMDVAILAMLIGKEMGYLDKEIKYIGMGGLLHDIGKAHIPLDILTKNKNLEEDEWDEMKLHSDYGYNLLRDVVTLHGYVKQMVYYHHERLDGSGYPKGLKGDEISPFVRIITVSDVFNALASNRHYREAMTPKKILEILYAESINKLDHRVVSALLKLVHIYPEGSMVKLSDGREAIVIKSTKEAPERPTIMIVESGEEVDLMKQLTLSIDDLIL